MLHNASALRTVLPWTSSVNTATAVPDISGGMGSARDEGLILRSCAQEKSYGVSSKAMGLGSWMPGPENRKKERRQSLVFSRGLRIMERRLRGGD